MELLDFAYTLPRACVEACAQPGDNDEACELWARKLKISYGRREIEECLAQIGAWSDSELREDSMLTLRAKLIWCASWDVLDFDLELEDDE